MFGQGGAIAPRVCAALLVACGPSGGGADDGGGTPRIDAGEGGGASDGGGGGSDGGGEPLFAPHRVTASAATLGAAMTDEVDCAIYDYVGGTGYSGSGACHTQGIAPTSQGIVASCQDQDDDLGLLVRFDGSLDDHGLGGTDGAAWTRLHGAPPLTHVVVGQGLEPLAGEDLIPAVSSDSESVPAEVTLLDIDEPRCAFVHDPGSGDRHLGASSLTSQDGTVYLAACSWDCSRFFVYEVDPAAEDCAPSLEASLAVGASGDLRVDAGAGDNNWGSYNSLALLRGEGTEVYLLAGHDGWIDTWELANFPGPAITFRKLAKSEWGQNQANHNDRDMFYEGMAIETPSESALRLWTAPHDFGLGGCGTGRSCMRAVYRCDIPLGP